MAVASDPAAAAPKTIGTTTRRPRFPWVVTSSGSILCSEGTSGVSLGRVGESLGGAVGEMSFLATGDEGAGVSAGFSGLFGAAAATVLPVALPHNASTPAPTSLGRAMFGSILIAFLKLTSAAWVSP